MNHAIKYKLYNKINNLDITMFFLLHKLCKVYILKAYYINVYIKNNETI